MNISPHRVPKRRVQCKCEEPSCDWSSHGYDNARVRDDKTGAMKWSRGSEMHKTAIEHTKKTGHLVEVTTVTWYQKQDN